MYNRLDTIPACDGRTDGRTDGQTDILPQHSPRYADASRGKKMTTLRLPLAPLTRHCQRNALHKLL